MAAREQLKLCSDLSCTSCIDTKKGKGECAWYTSPLDANIRTYARACTTALEAVLIFDPPCLTRLCHSSLRARQVARGRRAEKERGCREW